MILKEININIYKLNEQVQLELTAVTTNQDTWQRRVATTTYNLIIPIFSMLNAYQHTTVNKDLFYTTIVAILRTHFEYKR